MESVMRIINNIAKSVLALCLSSGVYNFAYADQTAIDITTTVDGTCTATPDFSAITTHHIQEVTNSSGAIINSETAINLGNVTCNAGSTLSLQSNEGGLKRQGGLPSNAPEGFIDLIPYKATTNFAGASLILDTAVDETAVISNTYQNAISSNLTIQIKTIADSDVVALDGNYRDTLTVKVGSPL
jgi:hypothetical protein